MPARLHRLASLTPRLREVRTRPATGRFVVHAYHGAQVRWDIGLEMDGMLASWTILKGPSLDPAIKRLIVDIPDRPLAHLDLQNDQPRGIHGSGRSLIWDAGTYLLADDEDPLLARQIGRLQLTLAGAQLRGGFSLVRMQGAHSRNWLLTKKWDAEAVVDWEPHTATPGARECVGAA